MKTDNALKYVLDSFAALSLLQQEAGAPKVRAVLDTARLGVSEVCFGVINYGEVLYTVEREKGLPEARKAMSAMDQWPVRLVDADRSLTIAAAHFKARYTLSYADAFVLALAQANGATVLTGDPEFRQTEKIVPVEWLPR